MLLIGAPGTGKTSFARDCHSEGGKTLILASDSNYRALKGERHVVDIERWTDFKAAVDGCPLGDYDTVAVDTLTQLGELAQAAVCQALGIAHPSEDGWGKSWQALRVELGTVFTRLEARSKSILYLAQEDTIEVQATPGRSVKKIVADIGKAAKRRVNYTVSLVGRIVCPNEGDRHITFVPRGDVEAKDNGGIVPGGTFPLDGRAFYDLVRGTK